MIKSTVFASLLLVVLASCTDPRLNAGLSLGANGVALRPSVSAGLGGGRLS